jgi:hypothetical protein
VPTPPVSAHDVAGGCCAAGFQSDLCPLWVIHDRCGRSHASVHVCFAPKAASVARMSEATSGFYPQAWTDHVARLDGLCECEAAPRDDAPAFAMGWPLQARYSRISLRSIRATCSLGGLVQLDCTTVCSRPN